MENTTSDDSLALKTVAKQFEDWRTSRKKHTRIPEHLWQAAVDLCKAHPTTQVCRCLRLSYADLKKRMLSDKNQSAAVQFMQIDLSAAAGNWQLCCQRADGAKLSLSANGPMPAIAHLLQQFLT